MDQELKDDPDRQYAEALAETNRRLAEVDEKMNRLSEEMDRQYSELRQKFHEIGILFEKIRSKFQALYKGLDNYPSRCSGASSPTRTTVPPG